VLCLVRHGESVWNLENRFTGWTDVPLSDKGSEEARLAAGRIREITFDKAYTSELVRAQDTLDIILGIIGQAGVPVERDGALNERHYGDLQGLNKDETRKKFGAGQVKLWRRSFDVRPPGGESLQDTAARAIPYFRETILADVRRGNNVLVSAHGNSLRAIVMDLDRLSPEEVVGLEIPTGVPYLYSCDHTGAVLSKEIREIA